MAKIKYLLLLLIFLGLHATPTYAQNQKIEKEIDTLEKNIGPFRYPVNSTGAQRLLPDISLIGTVVGGYFSQDPADPDEVGHDPVRTGFTLQEFELALQSVIDPYLRADAFISFSEHGVEFEEGYFTTVGLPKGFQIKGGKFLLPFGRQNQKHLELWSFADNMLVNRLLLGPEALNEMGVELSYLVPLPFYLQIQASLSNGENTTSFGGRRKQDLLYQGRVVSSFDLSTNATVLIGTSAAFGFNNTGLGNQTRLLGGDILFKWKPKAYRSLTWQTEYIHRWMQTAGSKADDGGFYSYLNYQFFKRWHAGLRYDYVGVPSGALAKQWRVTPALTFNPTEFSRLRVQYEYDKTNGQDAVHAAFLQLQFNMGPHGAHPF